MNDMIKRMLIFIMALSLLTGCQQKAKRLDDPTIGYTDESITNFLEETQLQTFYGDHWQVKIDRIIKVETTEVNFYLYTILIAPIYQERLALSSLEFKPCEYIDKTYPARNYGKYWNSNNDYVFYDLSNSSFLMDEQNLKHFAVRAELCLTNINNQYQQEMKIDDKQFDDYMRDAVITVKCDYMKKDVIRIHYDGEIAVVSDYTSDLYEKKAAVRSIIDGSGYPGKRTVPFKDEYYPLDKDITNSYFDAIMDKAKEHIKTLYSQETGEFGLLRDAAILRIGNQQDTIRGNSKYWIYPICCNSHIIEIMMYDFFSKETIFIDDETVVSRFDFNLQNNRQLYLTEYEEGFYLTDDSGYMLFFGKPTAGELPERIKALQPDEEKNAFSLNRIIHVVTE